MEPIRSDLRNLVNEILRAQPPEEAVVLAWPLVCGSEVAARSRAVSFADGTLIVEVQDTNWRSQLISFAPRYVAVFAELMGPLVKQVQFQVAGGQHSAVSTQHSAKPKAG
ncbi:MAG TPA: DUF721 domain-containing protein [Candidatus Angelobacter sp.]|nr:DUF721 domain-containing protein [Candidatus Angelobacter sp.]